MTENFSDKYLEETRGILERLDSGKIEKMASALAALRRRKGRLFILGVGGGAGHAGHAVNDFRKLCGIEAYAPSDNVSELTARINDDGWEDCYADWLKASRLGPKDLVLVFSVGGGDVRAKVSVNLVRALRLAARVKARSLAVVGRPDGFAARACDPCLVVPQADPRRVTPHTEGMQAVVWHLLISHPLLAK